MEREPFVIATTERRRIAVATDAAQIVGAAAAESYGVVAPVGLPPASLEVHIDGVRGR